MRGSYCEKRDVQGGQPPWTLQFVSAAPRSERNHGLHPFPIAKENNLHSIARLMRIERIAV
jgi:hypothetical protein